MSSHTLLPHQIGKDCAQALQELHASAERGEIIGISASVMLRRGRYFVEVIGEAARDPVVALGMTFVLAEELRSMARTERSARSGD